MMEAGVNYFGITPDQERFVRSEPVFYRRGFGGDPPMRYPADLYRSNYIGGPMFMDEPTMLLSGDGNINTVLWYWSDFGAVIQKRVRAAYTNSRGRRGRGSDLGNINLGDMQLWMPDYPCWETMRETIFYQMEGGCNGVVHEGRYQLSQFADGMTRWTGVERDYTPAEYFRYEYALLRGGTRPFDKFWGTSIYGQADPKITPLAVTMAYDMGARYVWYWTSDHDHHMPWPEQLELTRQIKAHAAKYPRRSIFDPLPTRDLAIIIPYGYFLTLAHGGESPHSTLWWVRELDKDRRNKSSQRYKRVMKRAHKAVIDASDRDEDFDITVDDGREITEYRRIVRISDEE